MCARVEIAGLGLCSRRTYILFPAQVARATTYRRAFSLRLHARGVYSLISAL